MDIVLASSSPRRKELLKLLTDDFKIIPADFEQKPDLSLSMGKMAEKIAEGKARAVFSSHKDTFHKDTLVIGADTIVFFDNVPLGKPKNKEDAVRTLKMLSGKSHVVATGTALVKENYCCTFSSLVKVTFSHMTDEEIRWYTETGEPMDKAGSYGINGHGALFIEKIEGDFYSVGACLSACLKNIWKFAVLLV